MQLPATYFCDGCPPAFAWHERHPALRWGLILGKNLLGVFLVNAILGQLISNTATALILIPIALSVAAEMGVSPMPLLMCVNVASAAALLTPVATPANIMVKGPGGYEFSDYVKLGFPLLLLYLVVAVFLVPFWWPW